MSDEVELVRYRLVGAVIDGPEHPNGAEVELRVLAKVEAEGLSDGMGGEPTVIRSLRVKDWAGPMLLEHGFAGPSLESGTVTPGSARDVVARTLDPDAFDELTKGIRSGYGAGAAEQSRESAIGGADAILEALAAAGYVLEGP